MESSPSSKDVVGGGAGRSLMLKNLALFFSVIVVFLFAIVAFDGRFLVMVSKEGSVSSTLIKKNSTNGTTISGPPHITSGIASVAQNDTTTPAQPSSLTTSTSLINHSSVLIQTDDATFAPVITIVVDLTGELGNNLHHIAHARGIQLLAREPPYSISTKLVLRKAGTQAKAQTSSRKIKKCFPNLRGLNYFAGNGEEVSERQQQQQQLLGKNEASKLSMPSSATLENVQDMLSYLKHTLNQMKDQQHQERHHNSTIINGNKIQTRRTNSLPASMIEIATQVNDNLDESIVSLPYVHVKSMCNRQFIDLFYDDYHEFFKLDENSCCKQRPYPSESVFHFRNFLAEFPKAGENFALEELSPNKTATELFGNGIPEEKQIAITTRFGKHPATRQYVNALTSRGHSVRVISDQTDTQDFCFLASAQSELVGNVRSTFLIWAGILSSPTTKVRLYSIESPSTKRKSIKNGRPFFRTYNWTNPLHKQHIMFELHTSEAMDEENERIQRQQQEKNGDR